MYLEAFLSPIVLTVTCLMLIFLTAFFSISSMRSREISSLKREMLHAARWQNIKSATVVVELSRRAETILPLLEHLNAQANQQLEVVVIVKRSAGKRSLDKLTVFNNRYQNLAITPILYSKRLSRQVIAQSHASGEIIIWLTPEQRVSDGFFMDMSLRFINPVVDAVVPRRHSNLDATLSSVLQAWLALLQDVRASFRKKPRVSDAMVYRRSSYLSAKTETIRYASGPAITTPLRKTERLRWRARLRKSAVKLFLGAIVVSLFVFGMQLPDWQFLFAVAISAYLALSFVIQSTVKEYGFVDRVNLLLSAPFVPFLFVLNGLFARKI